MSRLTTTVTRKFPDIIGRWSDKQKTTEFYFSADKRLTKQFESTKTRMHTLCKRALQIELDFWRRALRSKRTTVRGLRATWQRIRNLSQELGVRQPLFDADKALFYKQHHRRQALELLQKVREGLKTHNPHYPEAVTWIQLQLKKGEWIAEDIGTTEKTLDRLRVRLKHRPKKRPLFS